MGEGGGGLRTRYRGRLEIRDALKESSIWLRGVESTITKIRKRRDQLWAHTDMAVVQARVGAGQLTFSTDHLSDVPIIRRELEEVVEVLQEILNKVSGVYDGSSRSYGVAGVVPGVEGLLDDVRRAREFWEAERRRRHSERRTRPRQLN